MLFSSLRNALVFMEHDLILMFEMRKENGKKIKNLKFEWEGR